MYNIYTDGSCLNNPGVGATAFVVWCSTQEIYRSVDAFPHTTNNQMELLAVISAISYMREHTDAVLNIHTDSQYVIDGITKWMPAWKKRNWRKVKNVEFWKVLDSLNIKCNYIKVKAHADDVKNNLVNDLAQDAARKYKKELK